MKVIILRGRSIDSAPYKLAEILSQHGLDVNVLVWDRQSDLKSKEGKGFKIDSFRFRAPYDSFKVILYLPVWYLYELVYLLKDDADIILAMDIDTLWPAVLVRLIKRNKLYYMIYDFYANAIPDVPPRFFFRAVRKLVAFVEMAGIRFADTLFLTDEYRIEEVRGARIKKLVYIYNTPVDVAGKTVAGPTDRGYMEIFYAGMIAQDRRKWLEDMLKAIEDVDGIRMVIAGNDSIGLMNGLSGKLKEKVEYLGWISHDEVLKRTLSTDILFRLSDPKYPKSKYESPYKVFEAMMSSKPIIVSTGTRASMFIEDERCGLAVKFGDIAALKEAIVRLRDDPGLRLSLGANGRRAYENKYTWTVMEKRLLDAFGVK